MDIDVFVSHHTETSLHIVEGIVNKLESNGIRCWYAPRDTEDTYASSIADWKTYTVFGRDRRHRKK